MRKILLAGAMATGLASVLAGIGHNMPPVHVHHMTTHNQAILPRRVTDEDRRNQKLKQKRRRMKARQTQFHSLSRWERKSRQHGPGYRPGKLFKGHRI